MNSTIKCVHCGREFEISAAFKHDLEEQIKQSVIESEQQKSKMLLEDMKKQLDEQKKKNDEFVQQELELRKKTRELEEKEKNIELETARKIDEERKKVEEKILKEEEEKNRLKNKEKDEQIDNLKRMLEEANRKASQASQQIQGEVLELDLEEKLISAFPTDVIELL